MTINYNSLLQCWTSLNPMFLLETTMKRKCRHFENKLILTVPQVIKMATFVEASNQNDDILGSMNKIVIKILGWYITDEVILHIISKLHYIRWNWNVPFLKQFLVIGCYESCHFNNFLCSQWQQFCQNGISTSLYQDDINTSHNCYIISISLHYLFVSLTPYIHSRRQDIFKT